MVLTMPQPKRQQQPAPVPSYRHRTVVIDGRAWEVIERVQAPDGGAPVPAVSRVPLPPRRAHQAAA